MFLTNRRLRAIHTSKVSTNQVSGSRVALLTKDLMGNKRLVPTIQIGLLAQDLVGNYLTKDLVGKVPILIFHVIHRLIHVEMQVPLVAVRLPLVEEGTAIIDIHSLSVVTEECKSITPAMTVL